MKIIFVDAENVGFKGLDIIDAHITDKVFVFSSVASIQAYCQQKLFSCLSGYPEGANQADFYIIAYLSRVLASLSKNEKQLAEFILYSNDVNLINAFNFQCRILGAKSNIVSLKHATSSTIPKRIAANPPKLPTLDQVEQQIFNMLKKPQGLSAIQTSLNLSKPIFTKAVNGLLNAKKIKRCSKNGKNWLQA